MANKKAATPTRRHEIEEVEEETLEESTVDSAAEEQSEAPASPAPGAKGIPQGEMGARVGRPDELIPHAVTVTQVHRELNEPANGPERTGGGYPAVTMKPEQLVEEADGETVRMEFPAAVNLTLDDRRMVTFPAGHNDVPKALAKHPYLKASGVTKVEEPPVRVVAPAQAGHEAKSAPPLHKR